jgi:DNA helicase II / ATP-dependent DNA helicase PcrA
MQRLNESFERLNDEQKKAVLAEGNTVVMAGPGSGKTATLVVKIGYLISDKILPPAGLACVTYNNDAVREFRMRLADNGIFSRRTLFLGTVHSFCLNCIVRPYGHLIDERFTSGVNVAGPDRANQLFNEAASQYGADGRLGPTITRYRRARACNEDVSGYADTDPLVAKAYEDNLLKSGLIDFEGIIIVALHLIEQNEWIRELIAARFPWLIVDEYQDLGGPLHGIVTKLVDLAGVKAFAVGDPDQTIYDFTGASPQYLSELAGRQDFESIRLKFNYRSGRRIIAASQAALAPDEPRDYAPDPKRREQGEIIFLETNGHNTDHALKVWEAVSSSIAAGIKSEEIAIFYRAVGPLVEAIKHELTSRSVEFVWERDNKFPNSPFVIWLQRLAAWSLSSAEDREHTFSELFHDFHHLLQAAGQVDGVEHSLEFRILLWRVATKAVNEQTNAGEWLADAESLIDFQTLLSASEEYAHDLECYQELKQVLDNGGTQSDAPLSGFAAIGKLRGKVILTTFHASKGRQFDIVIIPGCAEGILPGWTWNGKSRRFDPPGSGPLSEARRLFYVGLSRARHVVYLINADTWEDKFGKLKNGGCSRFVEEIRAKLEQEAD